MPDIIRLLPESLANQIAAGEVVQRPASVVKELLENAIDAGATDIKLIIKEAGKTWIQVIDNGSGMSETDARMSFERHATSKIKATEDLFKIMTMGFRGEALASIAAVAQVELKTRKAADETGVILQIEASQISKLEPTQTPQGTSITVKNLFFNVPARRNFLKSNNIEFNHINEEFVRVALANPQLNFSFYNQDQEVLILPAGKLAQRILLIFGNQYKSQLVACQEDTPFLKITGYIGKPVSARKKRGDQYFFANKRFIKHGYLHHAVKQSFKGLIDEDEHPFYVLFFEIDPKHIDINVHPTKTEIKFDDEQTVYGIVNSAVRKAISISNLSKIDFSQDINNNSLGNLNIKKHDFDAFSKTTYLEPKQKISQSWENLYAGLEKNSLKPQPEATQEKMELRFKSDLESFHSIDKNEIKAEHSLIFQIQNSYIVTQVRSGMMIIDQQAAHERVLYDKFIETLSKKYGASQQFLFPLTLELSPADFELVNTLSEEIHALGFSFSIFGKSAIVINGVPTSMRPGDEKSLFEGFLEQYKYNVSQLKLPPKENLARALAKRSAIKKGTKLSQTEMSALLEQLLSSPNPSYSPDGSFTIVNFDSERLKELFAN